jgi:hypothetical protein
MSWIAGTSGHAGRLPEAAHEPVQPRSERVGRQRNRMSLRGALGGHEVDGGAVTVRSVTRLARSGDSYPRTRWRRPPPGPRRRWARTRVPARGRRREDRERRACLAPEASNPRLPGAGNGARVVLAEPERRSRIVRRRLATSTSLRLPAVKRVHLAGALAETLPPLADWFVPSPEAEVKELDDARWTELRARARPPGREDTFIERIRSERCCPVRPCHA